MQGERFRDSRINHTACTCVYCSSNAPNIGVRRNFNQGFRDRSSILNFPAEEVFNFVSEFLSFVLSAVIFF